MGITAQIANAAGIAAGQPKTPNDPSLWVDGGPVGPVFPLGLIGGSVPPLRSPPALFVDEWGSPYLVISDGYDPYEWFYSNSSRGSKSDAADQFNKARAYVLAANGWLDDGRTFSVIEPLTLYPTATYKRVDQDGPAQLVLRVKVPMPPSSAGPLAQLGVVSADGSPLHYELMVCRQTRLAYIVGLNVRKDTTPYSSLDAMARIIQGAMNGLVQGASAGYQVGGEWGAIIGGIVGLVVGTGLAVGTLGEATLTDARIAAEKIKQGSIDAGHMSSGTVAAQINMFANPATTGTAGPVAPAPPAEQSTNDNGKWLVLGGLAVIAAYFIFRGE